MDSRTEHQKLLIQQYKKQPKRIGAYCIRNKINQKRFIGVSSDVDARLNRHRFSLNSNSERLCGELQNEWNALGAESFEFTVLDMIAPPKDESDYDATEDLLVLEELWLNELNTFIPNGYNRRRHP